MADCENCIHKKICYEIDHLKCRKDFIWYDGKYGCPHYTSTDDVVRVRHSKIKWVNRPISAQYATVTNEYGEKHYGKVFDTIENNPVGYCGECGKRLDDTFMNYCPNCGAKMDGERKEE